MAEPRPGSALAAALQQTAHELAEEQMMATRKAPNPGAGLAHQLRRLEQQIEMERRQVERRLDKMERRIEEVASANASSGRWAELQGHVDGLEESLQNLIRGRSVEPATQAPSRTPSLDHLDQLDDQVLQISHRLMRLEHRVQGDGSDGEGPLRDFMKEPREVLPRGENFFPDWKEHTTMLEDQVGDLEQRLDEMARDLQEMMETKEAQDQVETLGQHSWRLAMQVKEVALNGETELRQELSSVSEDLTALFMRVEDNELGLQSMADALSRVCEELGQLKAPRTPPRGAQKSEPGSVTQPRSPRAGFAGASVAIDAPS